jgi:MoaA/NifB/PqqE/SkfB family radical SAM enzyme
MFIDNMIFEVTRRCNMRCRHCLRGKAEDLSMSKQTIQNALKEGYASEIFYLKEAEGSIFEDEE